MELKIVIIPYCFYIFYHCYLKLIVTFLIIFLIIFLISYQGVNQGFTGTGKWPLPKWNYQIIFSIEFMVTAKLLFFFLCVNVLLVYNFFFFLLFNLVAFFKNHVCLCCFLFQVFFLLLCYSYTEKLKKEVHYESATAFSCYTASLCMFVFSWFLIV